MDRHFYKPTDSELTNRQVAELEAANTRLKAELAECERQRDELKRDRELWEKQAAVWEANAELWRGAAKSEGEKLGESNSALYPQRERARHLQARLDDAMGLLVARLREERDAMGEEIKTWQSFFAACVDRECEHLKKGGA
jgi:chromosome segregation ATPase